MGKHKKNKQTKSQKPKSQNKKPYKDNNCDLGKSSQPKSASKESVFSRVSKMFRFGEHHENESDKVKSVAETVPEGAMGASGGIVETLIKEDLDVEKLKNESLNRLRQKKTNDDDDYDDEKNEFFETTPSKARESEKKNQGGKNIESEEKFNSGESDQRPSDMSDEKREDFVFFWKGYEIYSQWYMASFVLDGQRFECAEQYMMYQKALLFDDRHTAREIMWTSDPSTMKKLGRQVYGFSERYWEASCLYIVKYGNMAKFQQNKRLKEKLFATYPRILAEASPYDKIWGIGLKKDDPHAWNQKTWKGSNWLGFILTEVRDELMCEEGRISPSQKQTFVAKIAEGIHRKWLRWDEGTSVDGPMDKFVFFWKEQDIFSQWHESFFEVDNMLFTCAEQYMMYKKAETFGDEEMKQQVRKADHPRRMKSLCRQLSGHGYRIWNNICQEVVKAGNMAKFSQNSAMKEALFSTYPKILVEASPYDNKWGIGLEKTDPRANDESTWQGQNLLGYILTEVRDELMWREGLISEENRTIFIKKDTVQGDSFVQGADKITPDHVNENKNMEEQKMKNASEDDSDDQVQGKGQPNHLNKKLKMESSETNPSLGCQDTNQAGEKDKTEQESSSSGERIDTESHLETSTGKPPWKNPADTENSSTGTDSVAETEAYTGDSPEKKTTDSGETVGTKLDQYHDYQSRDRNSTKGLLEETDNDPQTVGETSVDAKVSSAKTGKNEVNDKSLEPQETIETSKDFGQNNDHNQPKDHSGHYTETVDNSINTYLTDDYESEFVIVEPPKIEQPEIGSRLDKVIQKGHTSEKTVSTDFNKTVKGNPEDASKTCITPKLVTGEFVENKRLQNNTTINLDLNDSGTGPALREDGINNRRPDGLCKNLNATEIGTPSTDRSNVSSRVHGTEKNPGNLFVSSGEGPDDPGNASYQSAQNDSSEDQQLQHTTSHVINHGLCNKNLHAEEGNTAAEQGSDDKTPKEGVDIENYFAYP